MARRIVIVCIVALMVFAGVYLAWPRTISVALPGGTELRVVKASVGTTHFLADEMGWKRLAVEILPDNELTRLGLTRRHFANRFGSVVLWLTEYDPKSGLSGMPRGEVPVLIYPGPGSQYVNGRKTTWGTNLLCVEYPVYPRADPEFKFRFLGRSGVAFTVKNPRPVTLENWKGSPLPQTNLIRKTEILLTGDVERPRLRLRSLDGAPAAWSNFRVQIEDTAGNRHVLRAVNSLIEWKGLPMQPGPLKVTVSATEFISAGFVRPPGSNEILRLEIPQRAADLHVRHLYLAGLGPLLVSNSVVTVDTGPALKTNEIAKGSNDATNWVVRFATERTRFLAIYDTTAGLESIHARLRERTKTASGGRIYEDPRYAEMQSHIWREHPRRISRQISLPFLGAVTNELEAEIMARHKAVEFIVER